MTEGSPVPVYEYYCEEHHDHYYSTSSNPFDSTWQCNGLAFYAYDEPVTGTVPVYSYYCDEHHDHEYSTSSDPFDSTWRCDGLAFYAYDKPVTGTVPVYAYYCEEHHDHEYSCRSTPNDSSWRDNQSSFYAYESEAARRAERVRTREQLHRLQTAVYHAVNQFRLRARRHRNPVGLASAPYKIVQSLIQDIKNDYPGGPGFFFHPDTDFEQFGVGPLNSANWVMCWYSIATVAGEQEGDVYFMKHVSGKFEGRQQAGELKMVLAIPGLKVHVVKYDDDGREVSRSRVSTFNQAVNY